MRKASVGSGCKALFDSFKDKKLIVLLAKLMGENSPVESVQLQKSTSYLYQFKAPIHLETDVGIKGLAKSPAFAADAFFSTLAKPCQGQKDSLTFIAATVFNLLDKRVGYLAITNAASLEGQGDTACTVLGDLAVIDPQDLLWSGPEIREYLTPQESMRSLARRWGFARDEWRQSYESLLAEYESQRVKVPVAGTDMSLGAAQYTISLLAVGLLAWGSFLARRLADGDAAELRPWLPIAVLTWKHERNGRIVNRMSKYIEVALLLSFYALALLSPLLLVVMHWTLGEVSSPIGWVATASLFAMGTLLVASFVTSFMAALNRANEVPRGATP
jgi:hypothetical protein